MNTTNIFNDSTKQWEVIEVDKAGFPMTKERILENQRLTEEAEDAIRTQEEANLLFLAQIEESRPPNASIYNIDTGMWEVFPLPSPAPMQIWDSWQQREDGLWYAPIDYPGENPIQYKWDELDQQWIDITIKDQES